MALSHSLYDEPETALAEHRSAAKIADLRETAGFTVTRGVGELPTALLATRGSGELVLGLCAEYDALPGIGHACGRNVNGADSEGSGSVSRPGRSPPGPPSNCARTAGTSGA
ncbi:hypothetical protein ACFW9M_04020 [Streptomyces lydicus]|uniref:hypothetical protein n=1 Tax=Streptomyces lydicus TaxID=47763 RepID=UPI0036AC69B4